MTPDALSGIPPRVREIIEAVAGRRGLAVDSLMSSSRVRANVAGLREVYSLLAEFAEPSQIAEWIGRDQTSVRKGLRHVSSVRQAEAPRSRGAKVVYLSLWRGRIMAPVGRLTMQEIAADVGALHGVTVADIRGEDRTRRVVTARNHAAWSMDQQPHLNRSQIGRWMGGRDRTTINNAIAQHEARDAALEAA
jgi:chromosomal replication initiation ATPase DnaA